MTPLDTDYYERAQEADLQRELPRDWYCPDCGAMNGRHVSPNCPSNDGDDE